MSGKLADNIVHFARGLRAAGLPVGPSRAMDAVRAVEVAGFTTRAEFRAALAACLISRPDHRAAFDAAFEIFWRDPQFLERMLAELMPEVRTPPPERTPNAAERRIQDALAGAEPPKPPPEADAPEEIEFDARMTLSEDERLKRMDFEQMSAEEATEAAIALSKLRLPAKPIASRRMRPSPHGRAPDWRAAARAGLRMGGELTRLPRRAPRVRWPNLVVLCDVSGSMASYSRMLLYFLHAAAARPGPGWSGVETFLFGTRLTRVTRSLAQRDVDDALAAVGGEVSDWSGGTRIGESLKTFNREWSRRVLGQGAVVLLITDGLERGDPERLAFETDRLRLSCRRLIWLNPLLRWDGFAPKAQGARILLPRVDSFRACHNIESVSELADALSAPDDVGVRDRLLAHISE